MKSIVVTGSSGKAGSATVRHLLDAGYNVSPVDIIPPPDDLGARPLLVDLTNYGETVECLQNADAVVHLANIPAPDIYTEAHTFNTNIVMNDNVFQAAMRLKLERVVWASSETTLGLPFDPPLYAPVDEEHYPHPNSTYALSKVLTEEMARHYARWSGIPFIGLRFTNIFTDGMYTNVPSYHADPATRSWNLFGYVDVRDVAMSCQNALEAEFSGADTMIIAAADTIIDRPSRELALEYFPDLEFRREVGDYETLLSIDKARRMIGYDPKHSWRDR